MNKTDYFFKKLRDLVTKEYTIDCLQEKAIKVFETFYGGITPKQKSFLRWYLDGLVDLYYSEKDFFELMDDFWKKKPTGIWHRGKFLING